MILINEWLPNPAGADAANEWIELLNSGNTSVNLSGWKLENAAGHTFTVKNAGILANGFLVLPRNETKLPLKNQDEALSLYNPQGALVDTSRMVGTAPEGQSYARIGIEGLFVFTTPTPGAQNVVPTPSLIKTSVTPGVLWTSAPIGAGNVILLAIGAGIFLASLSLAVLKMHHATYELLFGRDEAIRL